MKRDQLNLIEIEQCGRPGSIGDSLAETGRAINLENYVNGEKLITGVLEQCVTDAGFLRHPDSPWREDDCPTDQVLPMWLCYIGAGRDRIKNKIVAKGWKTDASNYVSPLFYCLLRGWARPAAFCLFIQSLLFHVPIRWSDRFNRFEHTDESCCDYLNWFAAAIATCPRARYFVSKDRLMLMVKRYYAPEPNCAWLIDLYQRAANKYWGTHA